MARKDQIQYNTPEHDAAQTFADTTSPSYNSFKGGAYLEMRHHLDAQRERDKVSARKQKLIDAKLARKRILAQRASTQKAAA